VASLPKPMSTFSYELCDRALAMPAEHRAIQFPVFDNEAFEADADPERSPKLHGWRKEAESLLNQDEIVASTQVCILVRYPLSTGAIFSVIAEGKDGFTRLELFARIAEIYGYIYDLEARTTETPSRVVNAGGNVTKTTGTFGVWGHPLEHLVLEGAWSTIDAKGETIWLEIGS
jgi:hypothetical protein